MCEFFSFLSDGKGSYIYADAKTRKENPGKDHDSHTWLAQHFLGEGASKLEDLYNKYEYNPFTRKLKMDNRGQNCEDDSDSAEKWCNDIDFKRIVPELIIKEITNPLTGEPKEVSQQDIDNLEKCSNSVRISVWNVCDSVGNSVLNSVRNSVRNSVEYSVWDSVKYSVRNSVRISVRNSVEYSVWKSVEYSVWNSVRNYIASFFDIKYDFDITPGNALWNRGFVPSFDGTTWRLHSGKDAKIVYEMKA